MLGERVSVWLTVFKTRVLWRFGINLLAVSIWVIIQCHAVQTKKAYVLFGSHNSETCIRDNKKITIVTKWKQSLCLGLKTCVEKAAYFLIQEKDSTCQCLVCKIYNIFIPTAPPRQISLTLPTPVLFVIITGQDWSGSLFISRTYDISLINGY